ncbi:MAG: hypothetical protein MJ252_09795 [archaeon]|nr:hypothetical protein [archaeon]
MKNAPLKKFQFFDIIEGGPESRDKKGNKNNFDASPDVKFTLNDVAAKEMHTLDSFVFLSSTIKDPKKSDLKNPLLKIYKNNLLDCFEIFNSNFNHFALLSNSQDKYLIALGADMKAVRDPSKKDKAEEKEIEVTSIKIYDISKWVDVNNDDKPKLIRTINLMKTEENGNVYNIDNLSANHISIKGIECFAVSLDFTSIAIGFNNGNVLVLTASQEGFIKTKDIKFSMISKITEEPITNLCYAGMLQDLYLIFSTETRIFKAKATERSLPVEEMDPGRGALKHCFDMKIGDNKCITAVNDGFVVEYAFFERGRLWGFEGDKKFVLYFKEYIVFSFIKEEMTNFAIYDPLNQIYIYYTSTMNNSIQCATYDNDSIYLLECNDINKKKKIIRLKEKDNKEKFDLFYKKSFFETAYSYAKSLNYEPKKLSEIIKKYAEHLYKKGEYEKSIQQYIKTINFLDPSYVIQQFLDGAKLDFLISYLEKLVKNETMAKNCKKEEMRDYTALLLNCYIKQKKVSKLKEFVDQKDVGTQIVETAIEVCKDTKETDLALSIAEKSNMTEAYIQILMDLKNDYEGSLTYLEKERSNLKKMKLFLKYGGKFLEKAPIKTMELLMPLVSDFIHIKNNEGLPNYSVEELEEVKKMGYDKIVSIFLTNEHERELGELLDYFMKEDPNCPPLILHHRIELYLDLHKKGAENSQGDFQITESIKEILRNKDYINKIDKNYIMMLFKYHNYNNGIIELSEIMELKQELIQLYMDSHNYDKIIEVCKKYGDVEMNYWIKALNYFINISSETTKSYTEGHIKTILSEFTKNEAVSPLVLLEILKKAKNIQVETVREVLLNFFKKNKTSLSEDKEETLSNCEKIEKLENEQKELNQKAKTFNSMKCSICNRTLNMPFYVFMCNHCFHFDCMGGDDIDDTSCPICKTKKSQLEQRINQANDAAKDHGNFALELQSKQKKFNLIAKSLGKGIFDVGY